MDPYYTDTGNRPDLAALPVGLPEGYIADLIYPVIPTMDKSGTVYYSTATALADAETGRVAGAAPGGTQLSNSTTTFTCVEAIKRYSVTPDEAKQKGGVSVADVQGAEAAKRSVMRYIEADVASLVLSGTASASFDAAKVIGQVQDAVDSMEIYEGVSTLITSTKTAKAMVQQLLADSTSGKILARVVSGSNPSTAITGLNWAAWKDALAMLLGVDQVLLGKSSIWNATAIKGRFAIAMLQNDADHKGAAVLGRRYQFLPDGVNPWYVESIADRLTKNNHYDASLWYDAITLNAGAKYLFGGVQDA